MQFYLICVSQIRFFFLDGRRWVKIEEHFVEGWLYKVLFIEENAIEIVLILITLNPVG